MENNSKVPSQVAKPGDPCQSQKIEQGKGQIHVSQMISMKTETEHVPKGARLAKFKPNQKM